MIQYNAKLYRMWSQIFKYDNIKQILTIRFVDRKSKKLFQIINHINVRKMFKKKYHVNKMNRFENNLKQNLFFLKF